MDKFLVFGTNEILNLKNVIAIGYFSTRDGYYKITADFGNGNVYKLCSNIKTEETAERIMKRINELFFDPNVRIIYSKDLKEGANDEWNFYR